MYLLCSILALTNEEEKITIVNNLFFRPVVKAGQWSSDLRYNID